MPFASKEKAGNDLGERYGCMQGNALTKPSPAGKGDHGGVPRSERSRALRVLTGGG